MHTASTVDDMDTEKGAALWLSVTRYFNTNPEHWNHVCAICARLPSIAPTSRTPSLRSVSYFVSKFAQTHEQTYMCDGTPFSVFTSYRQQLAVHTKHRFDPFCRRARRDLSMHGHTICTNVGQLVFFRWFLRHNIHERLCEKYDEVLADMRQHSRRRKRRVGHTQKKNTSQHASVVVRMSVPTDVRIIVRFD